MTRRAPKEPTAEEVLDGLREIATMTAAARPRQVALLKRGRALKIPPADLAAAAGLKPGTVRQIIRRSEGANP